MTTSCQKCHQHEYANWRPVLTAQHTARSLPIPIHNGKRRLMEDCLRCHGMHFDGAVRDLVQPQNTTGPWHITRASLPSSQPCPARPATRCITKACHNRSLPRASRLPAPRSAIRLPSSIAASKCTSPPGSLALPQFSDGPRPVKVSPDARQGLCYQCHAPRQPETGTASRHQSLGSASGFRRRSHSDWRSRRHELLRLPLRPQ